jgi:O-antigen/teichoic acid export membrane protein
MAIDSDTVSVGGSGASRTSLPAIRISKKLVLINSISGLIARFLNLFILLWLYNYLLARITPEEFAIYPLVASVMTIAPFFAYLLTGGISRFVTDACARGDGEEITRIVSSMFPLLAAGSLVFVGFSAVFAWQVDHVLNIPPDRLSDTRLMLLILACSFAIQTASSAHSLGFFVLQRFVQLNLLFIARSLLRIVLLFLLLFGLSTRVLWVVVANELASVAYVFATTVASRRMLPELHFSARLFSWTRAKELVSFGMWTTLGQFALLIHNSAGVLILNKLGTAVDVTSYYLGSIFDRQIRQFSTMASGPVQPVLTAMHSTGGMRRLGNAYFRGGRYGLWASLMVGVPLSIYAKEFIDLYAGNTYIDAAAVIVITTLNYPITFSNTLLSKIVMATAQVRGFFGGSLVTQVITVLLMAYFAGPLKMGAIGIAMAMTVTYVLSHALYFWPLALRLTGNGFDRLVRETLLPGLLPSAVGGAIWASLKYMHAPNTWLELGLFGAIGLVGYVGGLLAFCLQPDERRDLANLLSALRAKLTLRSKPV